MNVMLFFVLQSMLCRHGVYRLVVSHTFLYKKLDEYGKNHNEKILKKVICEGERLQVLEKTDINSDDHPLAAPDTGRQIVCQLTIMTSNNRYTLCTGC